MAIQLIETEKAKITVSEKDTRTATRTFEAHATSNGYTTKDVLAICAKVGDAFPGDQGMKIVSVDAGPVSGKPRIFTVSYSYSNKFDPNDPDNQEGQDPQQNPINAPANYSYSWEQYEEVLYEDKNGKAIVNSAGQRFAEPITTHRNIQIITVTANVANPNISQIGEYQEAVNSDSFMGCPPRTVRLGGCTVSGPYYKQTEETTYEYWQSSWTFKFKAKTWKRRVVDMGTCELINGQMVSIKEADGRTPISIPVRLDGNGRKLASNGETQYREFEYLDEKPFGSLISNLIFTG